MFTVTITVPAVITTPPTLSVPVSLSGFQAMANITAQLPSTAGVGDGVDFYGGNISTATSVSELVKIPNLSIPAVGSTGQQPSITAPMQYLYLYAVRTSISTGGALVAVIAGEAEF